MRYSKVGLREKREYTLAWIIFKYTYDLVLPTVCLARVCNVYSLFSSLSKHILLISKF